jgi:hypothetical protein
MEKESFMKGEAKELYDSIRQDLIRAHAEWLIFKQLFTVSDDRFELMSNTAPAFFRLIQDMLVDSSVISVSRLTDPASYRSLPRLVKLLKTQTDHSSFAEIQRDLSDLVSQCEDIKEHRHKRVAHRSRQTEAPMFSEKPTKLPPLTRKKIEGALHAMAALMNKILRLFESTEQIYYPVMTGDADTLAFFLQHGYEATRPPEQFR